MDTPPERQLVVIHDGIIVWKIATVSFGSEGQMPLSYSQCPYFQRYGDEASCISGSGGSLCCGFMGGTVNYVYCILGTPGDDE